MLIHKNVTNKLFEIIIESNDNPTISGAFEFEDRLKIFMPDLNKHTPIFEIFYNELETRKIFKPL